MAAILLVNPNLVRIPAIAPYALDILGSALVVAGHDVEVLDLTRSEEPFKAIENYFSLRSPDLVGISFRNINDMIFPSYLDPNVSEDGSFLPSHRRIVDAIKQHHSVERIIAGGVGFSIEPEQLLVELGLKYGVQGRGEGTFIQLANSFDQRNQLPENSQIFPEVKSAPFQIQRRFVDNAWYYRVGGLGNVRTSNGCAMSCSYCVEPLAKGSLTKFNLEHILEEIDQLVSQGVQDIHFTDSETNIPFTHSKKVLRAIADRKYDNVRFWGYFQPTPFDEEYADLLVDAGVQGVNFSSDHADEVVLRSMRKWYGRREITEATKLCNERGIKVMHELLFGHPEDTPAKAYAAIDFFRELNPWVIGVTVGIALVPSTPLHTRLEKDLNQAGVYGQDTQHFDPTFYFDPAFGVGKEKIAVFLENLHDYVGVDSRFMLPSFNSRSTTDNQLIDSERIASLLQKGAKGAYWYHFREF